MILFHELPDDIHEYLFTLLFKQSRPPTRFNDIRNLALISKHFYERFKTVCEHQCCIEKWIYIHRYNSIQNAAKEGRIDILKWFYETINLDLISRMNYNVAYFAVDNNRLNVLEWMFSSQIFKKLPLKLDKYHRDFLIYNAIDRGYFDCVKFLCEKHRIPTSAIYRAARNGHLEIVKWLYKMGARYSTNAMDCAAENGYFDVVKYLYENKKDTEQISDICTYNALVKAAHGGHFEIVKYLYGKGARCIPEVLDTAASRGHLDIVIFLDKNGQECTTCSISFAAMNGHLHVVKWLYEYMYKRIYIFSFSAMDIAAQNGHLDVVKYLHSVGAPHTMNAMVGAAKNGHLDVMKFLHGIGSDYTSELMSYAARWGHLDIVKFLYEKREKSWEISGVIREAVCGNHLNVIKWIYKNKIDFITNQDIKQALINGYLDLVKWLYKKHPTFSLNGNDAWVFDEAAARGYIDSIKWIHERGGGEWCTTRAMDEAIINGHLEIVKWLHANRIRGCSENLFKRLYNCFMNDKFIETLNWLRINRNEDYQKWQNPSKGYIPHTIDYARITEFEIQIELFG